MNGTPDNSKWDVYCSLDDLLPLSDVAAQAHQTIGREVADLEAMRSSEDLRRDMHAGISGPRWSLCPCAALRCCHIPTLPEEEVGEGGLESGWRHGCGREYRLGVGLGRGISLIGPPGPSEDHTSYCTDVCNYTIHCIVRGAVNHLPTSVTQSKHPFLNAQESAAKRKPDPRPHACATHDRHSWAEYRERLHRECCSPDLPCLPCLSVKKVMHERGCGSQVR